jgi:hypothetical protein
MTEIVLNRAAASAATTSPFIGATYRICVPIGR